MYIKRITDQMKAMIMRHTVAYTYMYLLFCLPFPPTLALSASKRGSYGRDGLSALESVKPWANVEELVAGSQTGYRYALTSFRL